MVFGITFFQENDNLERCGVDLFYLELKFNFNACSRTHIMLNILFYEDRRYTEFSKTGGP